MRVIVMGPSGSGKSTVGALLAGRMGAAFIDADDLHPASNVEKMSQGSPLDDDDRMPWLKLVGQAVQQHDAVVMACSALTRAYRDAIRAEAPDACFVELVIDRETLEHRMLSRPGHFMPASLLESQLRTLEPLGSDERGVRVDGDQGDVDTVVASILPMLDAQSLR
jgi:gluconokinase